LIPATDALHVLLHGDQDRSVVSLEGELHEISVPFVRDVIEQLLAPTAGAGRIEIHIEKLEHCDRAGFDLLAQMERSAKRLGRRVIVVRSKP
jgi:anti-anti-sigma regulatory factor